MKIDTDVVKLFIDTLVGIPRFSYRARQNDAKKPTGDFAHVRLIEEYQIGIPNVYDIPQDGGGVIRRTISPVRLRFRIGVIEDEGVAASRIMHNWTTEALKELMISTKYGFIRCTPLSSEDAQLEKEWEFREGFSVEFYADRVFDELDDSGNFIDSETISGKFVTPAEEILLTYNINND